MVPTELQRDLLAVLNLLNAPDKWTKKAPSRSADGTLYGARNDKAACWCLTGAIEKITYDNDYIVRFNNVFRALTNQVKIHYPNQPIGCGLIHFNDAPERTYMQVRNLLLVAILETLKDNQVLAYDGPNVYIKE